MPGPLNVTDFKKYAAFGSGVGIEIGGQNLEVTAARVRPHGIDVLGATTIRDFGQRPLCEDRIRLRLGDVFAFLRILVLVLHQKPLAFAGTHEHERAF